MSSRRHVLCRNCGRVWMDHEFYWGRDGWGPGRHFCEGQEWDPENMKVFEPPAKPPCRHCGKDREDHVFYMLVGNGIEGMPYGEHRYCKDQAGSVWDMKEFEEAK